MLIRITGSQLHAARVLVALSREDLAPRANRDASRAANGAESRSAKVLRWCAARLLLRTLTDEFAFRRISRIGVRVLPIQIEHHWQDIAASTPRLLCAD